ncbi:MAG: hypothetical protein ABL957_03325 [Parvularculaceae bacterium]
MQRFLIASAAVALAASAAQAAPFHSSRVSSEPVSKSETESSSILSMIRTAIIAKLNGKATAPVAKSKRPQPAEGEAECEASKKAEEEKQAEAKPGIQGGPEPMYLAF